MELATERRPDGGRGAVRPRTISSFRTPGKARELG